MFQAKDRNTRERQLKVIELEIPFSIVGSATAANVVPTCDEPALVFLATEGVDQITAALDSGEAAPTFASPSDSAGTFNIMVKVGESISKVIGAMIIPRTSTGSVKPAYLANTTGIDANGNKICLNCTSAVAVNTTNTLNAILKVSYVPAGAGI